MRKDSTVAMMKKFGVPLTVDNWIYLEYMGRPPASLEEISIPAEIVAAEKRAERDGDRKFLRAVGIRGGAEINSTSSHASKQA